MANENETASQPLAYATSYITDHFYLSDLLKIREAIEPFTECGRKFRVNIEVEVL